MAVLAAIKAAVFGGGFVVYFEWEFFSLLFLGTELRQEG